VPLTQYPRHIFQFIYNFKEWSVLGGVDLQVWADEGDLERAEIRLLPIVTKFSSEPDLTSKILGSDLSRRLRAFNQGLNLNAEALRGLLDDLIFAENSFGISGLRSRSSL
jgi:hypothetical protein